MTFNSNNLLPYDKSGNIISLNNMSKEQVLAQLINSGSIGSIVLLTRKVYSNNEFWVRGKVVCGATINYDCPYFRSGKRILTIQEGNALLSEIINSNTQFGKLVAFIFEQGQKTFIQGQYRQRGIFNPCANRY